MARNVALHVLRGVKANIPVLNAGELYLATDEVQLYIGTASGNKLVLASNVLTPPQTFGTCMAPTSAPGGPANPRKIVAFTKLVVNGTTYWIPLVQ